MTNSTTDLAKTTINLSNLLGTASPENTSILGDKPPFDRSLREATQLALTNGDMPEAGPEQVLPAVWQDLPREDALNIGLEGINEVRALAATLNIGLEGTNEVRALAATLTTGALSRTSDSIKDELDVSDTGAFITGSISAVILESASGSDLSNSEAIAQDSLRDQSKSPGNVDGDINLRTRSLTDIFSSEPPEVRTIISGSGLSSESSITKDNINRASSLEPNVGLSSISNSESKPANGPNATQTAPQLQMSKPSEIVSSTELATHLRVLKSSGGGEARLQLHPAELGRMTVSLITEGDEARVSFVVDNLQAKYSVEASLPRLRDLMDGAGLSLMDADVSERHSKNDEEQPSDRLMEEPVSSSAGGESESLEEVTPLNTSQLLDTFA